MRLSDDRCRELTEALRDAGRLPLRPGVLQTDGARVVSVVRHPRGDAVLRAEDDMVTRGTAAMRYGVALDLNDPATVGVLAGYARELWSSEDLCLEPEIYDSEGGEGEQVVWIVCSEGVEATDGLHNTRAEAWVDAILRAPGRGGE